MRIRSILAFLCTFSAVTLSAYAVPITGQISVDGYAKPANSAGFGSATGIDFSTTAPTTFSGSSGDLTSFGAGQGSFSGLLCSSSTGGCGTIQDISSFASEASANSFLTLTTGGPIISFDLSSISSVSHGTDASGGSVTFTALGTIDYSGYSPTAGELTLTADGSNDVSFSATLSANPAAPPAATPEPSSLVLLAGPMFLGAVQQLRRGARSSRS